MTNRLRRVLWAAIVVVACLSTAPIHGAGTVVTTSTDIGGGVTKYTIAWTSTAGGAVSGNTFLLSKPRVRLVQITFVPGTAGDQPSNLYDVTLTDADGLDLLSGLGANLSNATPLPKSRKSLPPGAKK